MDPVDNPPFPLWPIDEFGMEEFNSISIIKYAGNSRSNFVYEEVEAPYRPSPKEKASKAPGKLVWDADW